MPKELVSTTTIKVDIFNIAVKNKFDEEGNYDFIIGVDVPKKYSHEYIYSVYSYLNSVGYKTNSDRIFTLALIDFVGTVFSIIKSGVKHQAIEAMKERGDDTDDDLYA